MYFKTSNLRRNFSATEIIRDIFPINILGNQNLIVNCIRPASDTNVNSISFFRGKIKQTFQDSLSGLVLCENQALNKTKNKDLCLVVVNKPKKVLSDVIEKFAIKSDKRFFSIPDSQGSYCSYSSKYDRETSEIACNVTIESNVIMSPEVKVGSSSVLGCSGLGLMDFNNELIKFKDVGGLLIKRNVCIGSCCSIAKGVLTNTTIEEGVKIGNMVNIGHGAFIGKRSVITSRCMISGCYIGQNVWIAPNATILPGISISNGSFVGAGSLVTKDIPENVLVYGSPARIIKEYCWKEESLL